jgi:methylase of polypeptide subunit release factors
MTNGVFKQNLTSDLLCKSIIELGLNSDMRFLDLGCGDANIGLRVALYFNIKSISGSDTSEAAIIQAKKNAKKIGVCGNFKIGSGLDPWEKETFDVISCDVAAISERIAKLSDWYENISCMTGEDGLYLVLPIIETARRYLSSSGIFIIPCISLANEKKLEESLRNSFKVVDRVNEKQWPMPKSLIEKMKAAGLSEKSANWRVDQKFGIYTAYTSVYVCR